MPKSKREKLISLTKTAKKGNKVKEQLVEELRNCADMYESVFVFRVENMRNTSLKELRRTWGGSRFFFGKNKVMNLALGRSAEDEHKDNLSQLSQRITGNCGVLFTNSGKDEVLKFFEEFKEPNYARSGCTALRAFSLSKGPLKGIPFSMETHLRNLGLQTLLKNGVVELLADTQLCNAGDVLSPEQCKLLEIFAQQMVEFRLVPDCQWKDGEVEIFAEDDAEGEEEMED